MINWKQRLKVEIASIERYYGKFKLSVYLDSMISRALARSRKVLKTAKVAECRKEVSILQGMRRLV